MFTLPFMAITTLALLILLYGASWHDQPARPVVIERRAKPRRRE
jgi:hypothetical protein